MIEGVTLNKIIYQKIYVTLFLVSGFQMKGHIVSFDDKTILFDSMGVSKLIYKHAISTIEF